MQKGTLTFLKEYLSEEQQEILSTNAEQVRSRLCQKTDEQRFEEEAKKHKNLRVMLLQAVHKAETDPHPDNIERLLRCAVNQHDFITALYWHQKTRSISGFSDKFERYYYTIMAELQKQHTPDAEPCVGVSQMCKKKSDVSEILRNPEYLEHSISYHVNQVRTTKEKYNGVEDSVLLPAKKKDDNASILFALISLALLIGGGIFLWKTYGVVASAVNDFFGHGILSLITWIIPILYAILLIIADFALIGFAMKMIGRRNRNRLKTRIAEINKEISEQLKDTDEYRSLQEMDHGLPSDFHTYDARLVLAALSAMTGERDAGKLCKMAEDDSTWLSSQINNKRRGSNPYQDIDTLFKDDATDTDLFVGYTLTRWMWATKGLEYTTYNSGLALVHHNNFTPEDFKERYANSSYDFIKRFLSTPFGGEKHRYNSDCLVKMVERFLLNEALMEEKRSWHWRMGSAYFELYKLCIKERRYKDAYTYGLAGVEHYEPFKYYVMYNKACYDEDHEYYDPYTALGFTRADAEAYAKTLRGEERKELEERFKEVDRHTAERAAEARAAEARAYWEERGRLMREADAAREKARAELNAKMDAIERDSNLLFNGEYATVEERIMLSDRSDTDKTMDLIHYDALREAAIRKKLDDM